MGVAANPIGRVPAGLRSAREPEHTRQHQPDGYLPLHSRRDSRRRELGRNHASSRGYRYR